MPQYQHCTRSCSNDQRETESEEGRCLRYSIISTHSPHRVAAIAVLAAILALDMMLFMAFCRSQSLPLRVPPTFRAWSKCSSCKSFNNQSLEKGCEEFAKRLRELLAAKTGRVPNMILQSSICWPATPQSLELSRALVCWQSKTSFCGRV